MPVVEYLVGQAVQSRYGFPGIFCLTMTLWGFKERSPNYTSLGAVLFVLLMVYA
ncbi:hypothetical protein [Streptomyces sp. NBC_01465]|uniref:hypothetical protein n=1 Tax=Streptomyces sp. NBC_01465 TaxID=2903878 RepID=UPI002E2FC11C|nr:hypothetical protein [Streptomyces sp. NBC_01465]